MKQKILLVLTLLITFTAICQDERVLISEKKSGKRIILSAENTTNATLNVFFMVISEGFRRSASKPMIKDLPPKSKTHMITLIELEENPTYTYELIINDQASPISISYENQTKDLRRVIDGKLVLFSEPGCEKCTLLENALRQRRIEHRNVNLKEDPKTHKQYLELLQNMHPDVQIQKLPTIWNRDHFIFGYEELEQILKELKVI
ncbi:glutaredoxin family protein [Cochleicola gelatinilyticus]|uniref:Glutaredoxin domain-containing protein n=1 Tax=Cochleicola gelatinilyticus TaxID=1763537 RepID=A0A167K9K9_9FLAO|nr:glutaredoxin domain-containing protein [Cochleicola gelatinilyticus]OAB81533.1 hypothetical protein ULVI_01560 [Cochleicola gelatinilyticus]